jgi:hypothetical protein
MKRILISAILLYLLILSAAAWAAQIVASKGISLGIPDNWVILTRGQTQSLGESFMTRYPQFKDIDFNKIDIYAMDTTGTGFFENLNLVITPGIFEVSDKMASEVGEKLVNQYAKMGLEPSLMNAKKEQFNGCDAIAIHYELDNPSGSGRIQQVSVMIPGIKNIFILTFSFASDNSAAYLAGVNAILGTVKVEQRTGLWARLPDRALIIIRYTLEGVVAGGLIALVIYLQNRRKKKSGEVKENG